MAYGLVGGSVSEKLLFNYVSSLLVGVQTITPLVYQGPLVGSEFLVYSAKKLYIALSLNASSDNSLGTDPCGLELFDAANAVNSGYNNLNVDALASYHYNDINIDNVFFSRVRTDLSVGNVYLYIRFIGYKITIP